MTLKNLHSFVTFFCFVFLLAACGGDSESTADGNNQEGDKQEDEKVELRFAWWGSAERHNIYNEILDNYEEEHPEVKIVREPSSWDDYWTKLSTQGSGGNLPDIFGLHLLLYGDEYFNKNVIASLEPYVGKQISLEGWDESVLEAGTYKGDLLALAKGVTIQSLIANTSKAENLGLEAPSPEMNYQELKDYASEAVNVLPEGEYVLPDPTVTEHAVEMWARQKGGSFITENGKELGFSKEDLVEFWTYWDELRQMGAIPPAQLVSEQSGLPDESSLFAQGKTIFIDRPSNRAKMLSGYVEGDELEILRWPLMEDGEFSGGEQLQIPAIVMSNDSEHKEEAAELINYFVNDLEATEIYAAENGIPGTEPVRENLEPSLQPLDEQAIEHMEKVVDDIPVTTSRPAGSSAVLQAYYRYSESIGYGEISIEDAVDEFFAEAEQALSQN
ncbi:ABC transporter substrate-binding protein [Salibacterium aidingense]|uniref:ABC transporter substrate-binding protein n=1 Tax=Salibacterium aidingense TaxID=384933 RepID=UPI00041D72DD|nr:extracellular solute-binding protein [Salibacterium aidingense]